MHERLFCLGPDSRSHQRRLSRSLAEVSRRLEDLPRREQSVARTALENTCVRSQLPGSLRRDQAGIPELQRRLDRQRRMQELCREVLTAHLRPPLRARAVQSFSGEWIHQIDLRALAPHRGGQGGPVLPHASRPESPVPLAGSCWMLEPGRGQRLDLLLIHPGRPEAPRYEISPGLRSGPARAAQPAQL